ncbi:hypothetical protein [Mycobacterium sp. ACS4331]|uniref:hypothetical protein n=1 Tax=Mycobacterium sp. ACS4331 TaxID=1834121 RepID=UPI000800BD0B|nr:hypothetical protein [Mycobacterium sp. ACS4331]OBF21940.1 hypothetical protein A5727_08010 [Mycobacterium sp. ACS4331]
MPKVTDADGVRWSVRRQWMPLLEHLNMASLGTDWFGMLNFVVALPFILAWPFWLLAKLFGVPWRVLVKRDGEEVTVEKVAGWRASGRRIEEIAHGIRVVGRVPEPGEQLPDLRPYP